MTTVDFVLKRVPACRVATLSWNGAWSESAIHSHFLQVQRWAEGQGLRTGRWIFREWWQKRRWQVSVEVKGKVRGDGKVRVQELPSTWVASVTFDPDQVSPRVVYHGLSDWTRWRKKEKDLRSVSYAREVYAGDPWKDRKAWSKTEVQFLVRK